MKKERFATVEETAKAIISGFTEQQLKSLAVLDDDGKTISFEDRLLAEFCNDFPVFNIYQLKIFKKTKIPSAIKKFYISEEIQIFECFFSKTNPEKKIYEETEYKYPKTIAKLTLVFSVLGALWLIIKDVVSWI